MTFSSLKNLTLDGPEEHQPLKSAQMETGEHQPSAGSPGSVSLTGLIQSAMVPSPVVLRNKFYP